MKLTVLAAVAVLALAGCGTTNGVSTTADKPTSVAPIPTKAQSAKVGDTVTLKGNAAGVQAAVTVTKFVDPVKSTDQFTKPKAGNRFVGVQFKISNTGTAAYSDSPSNGAKVADKSGQQFPSSYLQSINAGPLLLTSTNIAPGGVALGFIVFEVPLASKVSKIQFGMESGFGGIGEWGVG